MTKELRFVLKELLTAIVVSEAGGIFAPGIGDKAVRLGSSGRVLGWGSLLNSSRHRGEAWSASYHNTTGTLVLRPKEYNDPTICMRLLRHVASQMEETTW